MIRAAQIEDIPALIALGKKAVIESRHPAKLDETKTKKMLFHAILLHRKNGPVRIYVAENKGIVVGLLIGQVDTLFYSKDKYATDLVFYVLPEHRGCGTALVKRFIKWAWSVPGVVDITLQQSSGIGTERTSLLYERLGFKLSGACYTYYRSK